MSAIDFSHVTFISAGAGSGKTYRLTQDLERALVEDQVHPSRVIGTTFTVKAAGELKERVRSRLIESGHLQLSEQMAQALIGTVHSVCERLLKRFSFELGLSPELNVISIEDGRRLFNQALDDVISIERVRAMNAVALRLGQENWQEDVKRVAEKVRENDIDADDLPGMAKDSATTLLGFFRKPTDDDPTTALQQALDEALAGIDLAYDTTQATNKYHRLMADAQHELNRGQMRWSTWIALSSSETGKKSQKVVGSVQQTASRYETHPGFHADVQRYIQEIMQIACIALEQFQSLKTERGLIDFLDMEQLTLHALDVDIIRERIAEELDLLMVDEFQDTNPMQLALFVKLAALSDRAIFVGDVKQAIYAFRGCDPDLVFSTLRGMASASATTDNLESCWRSRPPLVQYINEVFSAAFEVDGIQREQVALNAERKELTEEPALFSWLLDGNAAQQTEGLAEGVSKLVMSGHEIVDPETHVARPVRWGDIAILARTNEHVETIARTLRNRRVPMKMSLSGLLATPEVILARACLRRLNDPTDTLATAEILSLADCSEPESWLTERLAWIEGEQENYRWAEDDHPLIGRLHELRPDSAMHSPLEIVARVINDVGTRVIVTSWGPDAIKATQRQRNLDAFLDLAAHYEEHCAAHHEAASLTGFLFWLEMPSSPELDLQPTVTSGDAVHVLTYHKAKGLEWPVVIAADLNYKSPNSVFDLRVNLTADFDVNHPLANRTIQLWPNVFGRRTKNLPPLQRILDSDEGHIWAAKNASEDRRLAYVGLTRARDLLTLAAPPKLRSGAWIDCFNNGFTLPTKEVHNLSDGQSIDAQITTLNGAGEHVEPTPFAPRWFIQRTRQNNLDKALVSPSSAPPLETAQITESIKLGERLPLRGDDMTAIGNALHAVIAAELVNPSQPDAQASAEKILQAYGVEGFMDAADALAAARRLHTLLMDEIGATKITAECPIQQVLDNGQVVRGVVDLLVDTPLGPLIIDHKSSPRPKSEWSKEVIDHGGQMQMYEQVVAEATGRTPRLALHFPVSAGLVSLSDGLPPAVDNN